MRYKFSVEILKNRLGKQAVNGDWLELDGTVIDADKFKKN